MVFCRGSLPRQDPLGDRLACCGPQGRAQLVERGGGVAEFEGDDGAADAGLVAAANQGTREDQTVVVLAYALGGLAGALYAPFAGFANTELVFRLFSGQVLILVIVGGSGTLIGPIRSKPKVV